MKVFRTIDSLRQELKHRPHTLGLVPTMGALHEGHLALIRKAAAECETAAISIFVNPTQFGPNEDLSKYPRQEAQDLELAEAAGAQVAFCPGVEEMYSDSRTVVRVEGVSEGYEGAIRPGHFDGVATVVAKLFHIFSPTHAYFGWKDLQQCAVIRQMVRDLKFPLELRFVETVRTPGGLALSSRNAYLSESSRVEAEVIARTLRELCLGIVEGTESIPDILASGKAKLEKHEMTVDYLDLVDPDFMKSISSLTDNARLTVAVRKDGVRLLDNIAVREK